MARGDKSDAMIRLPCFQAPAGFQSLGDIRAGQRSMDMPIYSGRILGVDDVHGSNLYCYTTYGAAR